MQHTPNDLNDQMVHAATLIDGGQFDDAIALYRHLISMGVPEAEVALASLYEDGDIIEKDLGKAEEMYKNAAKSGNLWARYNLAAFFERAGRDVQARELLLELIPYEYPPAMNRLANFIAIGKGGPRDFDRALNLRERAAHRGHVWALKWLAREYKSGRFGYFRVPYCLWLYLRATMIIFAAAGRKPTDIRLIF